MLTVRVPVEGAAVCRLSAPGGWARVGTRSALSVRFRFRVAPRARPGRYRVTTRCDRRTTVFRVTVNSARGDADQLVGSRIRTHLIGSTSRSGGTAAPPPDPALVQARADAQAEWDTITGRRVMAGFRTGQCTDWTARKRPDIIERVWVDRTALLNRRPGRSAYEIDWTAEYWDDNARAAGLVVGTRPRRGAIAVFEAGAAGASPRTGHVAYVERVSRKGVVTISEMNAFAGPGRVDIRAIKPQPGISFIY
jgi:hypothetical protein